MKFEITTKDEIFMYEINECGKYTGKKYPIEEEVEALETIGNAVTSKMMEIINITPVIKNRLYPGIPGGLFLASIVILIKILQ